MELLDPVQGVGDEEVPYLGPAVVENISAPVQLLTATRIGMFVLGAAVEARERPLVLREVGGHPVHDHADPGGVETVDERAELVGSAEPGGGSVVGGDLVAPRPAEGMLGDRQQLDVRESGFEDVLGQLIGEFDVVQARAPRTEVHLVDRHRFLPGLRLLAGRDPVVVVPGVATLGDLRRGRGGHLGGERHRIGFVADGSVTAVHPVLVQRARFDTGNEDLPDTARAEHPHRVVRPPQPSKSPVTVTPRAPGAHTAKDVPVTGPSGVS